MMLINLVNDLRWRPDATEPENKWGGGDPKMTFMEQSFLLALIAIAERLDRIAEALEKG